MRWWRRRPQQAPPLQQRGGGAVECDISRRTHRAMEQVSSSRAVSLEYCIVLAGGSRYLKSCSAQISVKILLITELLLPQGMCCRPVVNPSRVHVATTCCPDTTGDKKGNTGSPSCTAERATILPLRLQSCTPETT